MTLINDFTYGPGKNLAVLALSGIVEEYLGNVGVYPWGRCHATVHHPSAHQPSDTQFKGTISRMRFMAIFCTIYSR
jgi:hypothetical protein